MSVVVEMRTMERTIPVRRGQQVRSLRWMEHSN